ncbi:MAG: hypothetical protein MRJ65_10675 [Candidatus Brocadiaceae bacterium]|nr:hypothetical protein [Candidatus Brocadiaceae bacterium]
MLKHRGNKTDYRKSNRIENTPFKPSAKAKRLAKSILASSDAAERQTLGQKLFNELSCLLSISSPQLVIQDKRQSHSLKDGKLARKTYGTYRDGRVTISNKTAIRQSIVAPKTFMDTLIHEFMHHYDYEGLKLSSSLHTTGFYYRLADVMKKLVG